MPRFRSKHFIIARSGCKVGIAGVHAHQGLEVDLKNTPTAKAFYTELCRIVATAPMSEPIQKMLQVAADRLDRCPCGNVACSREHAGPAPALDPVTIDQPEEATP